MRDCPTCKGVGLTRNGGVCPTCDGEGSEDDVIGCLFSLSYALIGSALLLFGGWWVWHFLHHARAVGQ